MTSEKASCHAQGCRSSSSTTRRREEKGGWRCRCTWGLWFWGCLGFLYTTSSHPWKFPSAHQRPMSVEDQKEHPLRVRERWECLGSPTKLLPKHQKNFPLHFQGCKAVEQMANALFPQAMASKHLTCPVFHGVYSFHSLPPPPRTAARPQPSSDASYTQTESPMKRRMSRRVLARGRGAALIFSRGCLL